jgi:hypothetical protein
MTDIFVTGKTFEPRITRVTDLFDQLFKLISEMVDDGCIVSQSKYHQDMLA